MSKDDVLLEKLRTIEEYKAVKEAEAALRSQCRNLGEDFSGIGKILQVNPEGLAIEGGFYPENGKTVPLPPQRFSLNAVALILQDLKTTMKRRQVLAKALEDFGSKFDASGNVIF